ncbi:A/G-specific adenine glycosylase, partial [Candidatus Parcubacteria bacterium]|nr:A/G-specific adenine glycosylase [Candidatus Parcubacteria bacterium]
DYGAGALREIENPNRRGAHYARQPAFKGSNRQLRGRALAAHVAAGSGSAGELLRRAGIRVPLPRLHAILEALAAEGLARKVGRRFALPT